MHSLSATDGSADAVQRAAAGIAAADDPTRLAVERELDRVNGALQHHVTSMAQHVNGVLLVHAVLLVAFLVLLVAGWTTPLPAKRWLLAAFAGFAVLSLILAHVGVRVQLARAAELRLHLRLNEEALERIAGRSPVFVRHRVIAAFGRACIGTLPLLIAAGWASLVLYSLALPLPAETRVAAEARGEPAKAPAEARPPVVSAPRANRPAPAKEEPVTVVEPQAAERESPLAAFLRRAASAPATESTERVTP